MEKASSEGGPTGGKQIMIVARNQKEGSTQEGCQDGKLQLSSESDRVFLLSLKWCI